MDILRTEGLVKTYKRRRVVNEVAIEIKRGEIVGLLGPNGAGKTTTFYMIIGLVKPEAGKVILNDEDISYYPVHQRARKGIGYLSQEPSVFRRLTVEENILAILEVCEKDKSVRQKRLEELLELLHLKKVSRTRGISLSGGERRRVEIARALVPKPSFLLLDEPFTGIDPIVRSDIQTIVKDLKERGLGILITDHNVRETLEITDRAYIISDGKVLISGSSLELVNNPEAKKIYLGENFSL